MKNKIFAVAAALALIIQVCAVSVAFASDGFSENFDNYEVDTDITTDGWTGNSNVATVIEDPFAESSSNKVLQVKSNYGHNIKKNFDAMDGVSDISFLMAWNDVQSYSHTISVRSGSDLIIRFGVFRIGWGNHLGVMNKDMTVNSGNTNESDIIDIRSSTSENTWYSVKMRIDCNNQTFDVVIAPYDTVITEDMMENPENYSDLSYQKGIAFLKTENSEGNKIDSFDNISIDLSSWNTYRTAYYDNISITPFIPIPKYNVTFRDWDGSETTQLIRENETVPVPEEPIRPGYMFDGWFLNGQLYDFDTPVTGNILLEAKYTKRTIVLDNTFEEYDIDTDINGQDGWAVNGGNAAVVDDTDAPGENKVLKMSGGYNITKEVAPTGGVFDLSYRMKWEDGNNARGQGMHFKCGDKYIARVGIFRNSAVNWRNDFGVYKLNDGKPFSSGSSDNIEYTVYDPVRESVSEKNWYYVKIRFDFNTQIVTTVISNNEITDEAIDAPDKAEDILGYDSEPFLNSAEYLDAIDFNTAISNNVTYYDDFYIADVPDKEANYAISNATWTQNDENISVSANITKGSENAVIFTAVYNNENELVAADVNRDLSSVSEGETYNYQVQLSATAADSVKIMVWDTELIPKTGLAVAELVQQ